MENKNDINKYCIWNNKGGVGKTFLTFAISTEYAIKNPEKTVCVIDMCPQANISEILLGGSKEGHENLLNQANDRKTIGGYFDKRLSNPDKSTKDEDSYLIQTNQYVKEIPENLYLICGDPSLELQVQSINQIASVDLPETRWKNVHKWLIDLQEGVVSSKICKEKKVIFFIDCNPSFATYTAQSIVASNRLIVPCTADGSSARAIDNIGNLVYGEGLNDAYEKTNFSHKANNADLVIPKLFLVIMNRYTTSGHKPSSAFLAMFEKIRQRTKMLKDHFFNYNDGFKNVPDAHTASIVACEKSTPISKLKHGSYDLLYGKTQLNPGPLNRYKKAINEVVNIL